MTYITYYIKDLWKKDKILLIAIAPMAATLILGFPMLIFGLVKAFANLLFISSMWVPSILLWYINKK